MEAVKPAPIPGILQAVNHLAADIVELVIALEAPYVYQAGQFAEIHAADMGNPKHYSIARAFDPAHPNLVSIHLKMTTDGTVPTWLRKAERVGSKMTVAGPMGTMGLRPSDAPLVCIAGGTGLAPMKAIIEQLLAEGATRPVTFVFGARNQGEMYCQTEMTAFAKAWKSTFHFLPVLSDEPANSGWTGARGLVSEPIASMDADFSRCHVYVCGPGPMVRACVAALNARGVGDERIFYDRF